MFGTALNYVCLRILGVSADHPVCIKARATMHKLGRSIYYAERPWANGPLLTGGAACAPSWGKFWLSVLSVYEWEGMNPVPPELLYLLISLPSLSDSDLCSRLIPEALPIHPHRWWIQTRVVFIPMSYLYGVKFKAPEDDLILSLREVLRFTTTNGAAH